MSSSVQVDAASHAHNWLVIFSDGLAPANNVGMLAYLAHPPANPIEVVKLGEYDGQLYSAAYVDELCPGASVNFKMYDGERDPLGRRLFGRALALRDHALHNRYCPRTGERSIFNQDTYEARSPSGGIIFPRIDPAVVVLVANRNNDRVLMASNAGWPPKKFGLIAGFVEPGESLEEAVRRECYEEVGIDLDGAPHYLSSDIWPFPRSLMLAFKATADDTQPVTYHDNEVRQARWLTRGLVQSAIAGDQEVGLELPPFNSLPRRMLSTWANSDAPSATADFRT